MIVRGSLQYNLQTIEDPEPYQYFFQPYPKRFFWKTAQNFGMIAFWPRRVPAGYSYLQREKNPVLDNRHR